MVLVVSASHHHHHQVCCHHVVVMAIETVCETDHHQVESLEVVCVDDLA